MANENIFTTKASDYAAGRPSYAPEASKKILSEMLKKGDRIADIGSGTGIFLKEFLLYGYETFGVEPNDAMRMEAEKAYGSNELFHSVSATAENTSLPTDSISLVTAASAFHWFDTQLFYKECKRILKTNGIVCIIANERTYDSFTKSQHQICEQYCNSFTSLAHGAAQMQQKADAFYKGKFFTIKFGFPLHYTKQNFIFRSLSSSYAPEKNTREYEGYIRSLQTLLDDTFLGDEIVIANETKMFWGNLS